MRTLFIIPLVLMSLVSFPSWGVTSHDLVYEGGLYYKKSNDPKVLLYGYGGNIVPFTGEITGDDVGSFVEGKREGSWISYHDNGQLWTKGNFENDERIHPADGLELEVCFGSGDQMKVSLLFDSIEAFDIFGERFKPILEDLGMEPGTPEVMNVHHVIRRGG